MSANSKKVKFAAQADPQMLSALRRMAQAEGHQLQALIDEAQREHVEGKQGNAPRRHVMSARDDSLLQYDELYRKLSE